MISIDIFTSLCYYIKYISIKGDNMLNNREYFNQFIMNSENVQSRLAPITAGFPMEAIAELINLDIQVNHAGEESFHGKLPFGDSQIEYDRGSKQFNPMLGREVYFREPRSYIQITKGDLTVSFTGNSTQFSAKRGDSTQTNRVTVSLDPTTGMLMIDTKLTGFVKEPLDAKQMAEFQKHGEHK